MVVVKSRGLRVLDFGGLRISARLRTSRRADARGM